MITLRVKRMRSHGDYIEVNENHQARNVCVCVGGRGKKTESRKNA